MLTVEIIMNARWVHDITKGISHAIIMKQWLVEGKYLNARTTWSHLTTNFNNPYQILIALISKLHGMKDAIFFKEG